MIEPAQPQHADLACELIYQSGPAAFSHVFNQQHGPDVKVFLRHLFRTPKSMFSHTHHFVYLESEQVVATIGSFSKKTHRDTFAANAMYIFRHYGWRAILKGLKFENRLVKPPQNGCLYLCHIAVSQDKQGHGIATKLVQHMESIARKTHYQKLSLDVAQNNQRALNLYLALGFKIRKINQSYNYALDNHIYMEKLL